MSSISRSFKRKSVLQRRQYNDDVRRGAMKIAQVALQGVDEKYQQDIKTYNDAAIIVTAAAAANVLVEHWGKMQKKETRIDRFMELYVKELENFPREKSEALVKARKLLKEKWDIDFTVGDDKNDTGK